MAEKLVHIPNISCGHCAATIEREIGSIKGVSLVHVDLGTKNVTVVWDEPADWKEINDLFDEIEYPVEKEV